MTNKIRKHILDSAYYAKHGHMPSALSIVEIICAFDTIRNPEDILVLSKGHGCLAYYAYLVEKGTIDKDELKTFGKKGSRLGGHPDKNKVKEVHLSTGSLGQGLPMAVGSALARKIMNKPGNFYCIIGDGECNEGSIWESIQIAVSRKINNLVCIVDLNQSQIRSLQLNNLYNKFTSFGCNVIEVDGHDLKQLSLAMDSRTKEAPLIIIANTVKGKGLNKLENDMFAWHHRAPDDEEYNEFKKELNEK
jgi:transketolase